MFMWLCANPVVLVNVRIQKGRLKIHIELSLMLRLKYCFTPKHESYLETKK